jgi:carnitine 3-dehydrogenase
MDQPMTQPIAQPIAPQLHAQSRITTPLEGTPAPAWDADAPIAAPLHLYDTKVLAQWVDYNGHMSESCYLLVFGDHSDAFFRYIGVDEAYRQQAGHSFYTVQTHIHHLREVAQGEPLRLSMQLLDYDAKRVHVFHSMHHARSGDVLAVAEQMLVHVNMAQGRSAAMPAFLQQRVQAIAQSHARLDKPAQVGRTIEIRRAAV